MREQLKLKFDESVDRMVKILIQLSKEEKKEFCDAIKRFADEQVNE